MDLLAKDVRNSVADRPSDNKVSPEVRVRVLRTVAELEAIRAKWEFWPGTRDSDLDFYLTVLRENPGIVRPHVILVEREGQPDAILIGRIDHMPIRLAGFSLGYLGFRPKARILYFVYGALRGNGSLENSELFVRAMCQSLSQGEGDACYLNFLRTDSDLARLARSLPGGLSRDRICLPQPHFSAAIPRSIEEYYRGLSSNTRWQAKSKQKKIAKAFPDAVKIRCFRQEAELDELMQDVERIATKSYQRGLGVGFVNTPATRKRLQMGAQKGWLRAYVLYLGNRACAFWIGVLDREAFSSDYLAYDADMADYSPGTYLVTKVIEGFCNGNPDRATEVDFASGFAQYKKVLSNREWQEATVYIFGPSFKGLELNLARTVIGVANRIIKNALGQTKLLQRIKTNWRTQARQGLAKATQPSQR